MTIFEIMSDKIKQVLQKKLTLYFKSVIKIYLKQLKSSNTLQQNWVNSNIGYYKTNDFYPQNSHG